MGATQERYRLCQADMPNPQVNFNEVCTCMMAVRITGFRGPKRSFMTRRMFDPGGAIHSDVQLVVDVITVPIPLVREEVCQLGE